MRRAWWVGLGTMGAWICCAGLALAQPTVVMRWLDNPRGLTFGPDGALYVAEAGRGGPSEEQGGTCGINGAGETACVGNTGGVSRLFKGRQTRVASGLPSAAAGGFGATGPQDIAFLGRGGACLTIGLGGTPEFREALGPGGQDLGTLMQMSASGKVKVVADLLAHEIAENPAGGLVDSNPFGVAVTNGGCAVADAGGNSLVRILKNGTTETLASFGGRPTAFTDTVPTGVTIGPDGAYYVGQLTGGPFMPNAATIFRVEAGQAPEAYLTGFTTITDLAFGPDGSLYVVELGALVGEPGRVVKVAPDGTRSLVVTGLFFPMSVAVGPDGALYVSVGGILPGAGQVIRVAQ